MKKLIPLLLIVALVLTAVPAFAQVGPGQYWVQRGDTWTSVSTRLGVPFCRLVLTNGHRRCSSVYRASSALVVGQTLQVPVR